MPITEDNTALVSGADMARWFIGLLLAYLVLAFLLGLRTSWPKSWKVLARLSLLATLAWLILTVALSLLVILDRPSDIPSESHALAVTFGMPFEWHIPARLLFVPSNDVPAWLEISSTSVVVALILLVLASVPYAFAQLLARGYGLIRSKLKAT